MKKQFIEEQALLEDAFRLAVNIFDSGFRPDFIVGIWRGGSTVGIYVQECLQYLGVKTDHIAYILLGNRESSNFSIEWTQEPFEDLFAPLIGVNPVTAR